jgi:Zn-dependent protease with chaperone function
VLLPVAFLLGLGVLALAEKIGDVLPGSGSLGRLLVWCLLLPVPAMLAMLADRTLRRQLARGLVPGRGFRLWLRLLPGTGPCVYLLVLTEGTWLDLADRWSGGTETFRLLLLLLPLLLLELSRSAAEVPLRARLDRAGLVPGSPTLREHVAMIAFLVTPLLLFGLGLDLLARDRWLEVLCRATAPGMIAGLLCFLCVLGVLMPLAFRWLMATSAALPPHLADGLRATAKALGFRPGALLSMHTGHRLVNAAMVGPLPWPRYLVLTDGLLAVLDLLALRGVVAHEVGHARAGHPGLLVLLFVGVPLLLVQPLELAGVENLGPLTAGSALVAAVGLGVFVLRQVAHRFEHEADVLSAQALGGAGPCITALRRVGTLTQLEVQRSSLRHPSEQRRIECLLRWEDDPGFRRRFVQNGRWLRRAIGAACGLALALALATFWISWPIERTVVDFYTGKVATASARAQAIGTQVPAGQWEWWQHFREEIDAAAQLAPGDQRWEDLRPQLAEGAWQRGLEVLRSADPGAARPWFALATEDAARSPVRRSVHLWCEAVQTHQLERAQKLRAHLESLDLPAELREALKVSNG